MDEFVLRAKYLIQEWRIRSRIYWWSVCFTTKDHNWSFFQYRTLLTRLMRTCFKTLPTLARPWALLTKCLYTTLFAFLDTGSKLRIMRSISRVLARQYPQRSKQSRHLVLCWPGCSCSTGWFRRLSEFHAYPSNLQGAASMVSVEIQWVKSCYVTNLVFILTPHRRWSKS